MSATFFREYITGSNNVQIFKKNHAHIAPCRLKTFSENVTCCVEGFLIMNNLLV